MHLQCVFECISDNAKITHRPPFRKLSAFGICSMCFNARELSAKISTVQAVIHLTMICGFLHYCASMSTSAELLICEL